MTQFEGYTIMGTAYGEIFTVKSEHFYSDTMDEQVELDQKSVRSKCFSLFDSPITNLQVVGDRLFASAKDCCSIVEMKIHIEEGT